jgi:hypothetical protein
MCKLCGASVRLQVCYEAGPCGRQWHPTTLVGARARMRCGGASPIRPG